MEKKELRRDFLKKRRSLSSREAEEKGRLALAHLLHFLPYRRADVVMCYAAMKDEVQTRQIMEQTLALQKNLCIPYVRDKAAGWMDATAVGCMEDLTRGAFDILTVRAEWRVLVEPQSIALILIPGVAFDFAGHRLGMGAGFYDRFLSRAQHAVKVGLAFACQMAEKVPFMPHDCPMDYVITEEGIINCKTGKM